MPANATTIIRPEAASSWFVTRASGIENLHDRHHLQGIVTGTREIVQSAPGDANMNRIPAEDPANHRS